MPHDHDEATWQPISAMPLIGGMIAGALEDTREHLATLAEARSRPHVLDDEALDRSGRVHGEQLEFVAIYEQQIGRWRAGVPSATQVRELDGIEEQACQLRVATEQVLALLGELRRGSIDRVMGLSDAELGLQALLGTLSTRRP